MNEANVTAAFETLIEAFQQARYEAANAIQEATTQGDLAKAQQILDHAWRIERFLSAIQRLRDAWEIPELPLPTTEIQEAVRPLPRGMYTPYETPPELAVVDRIFGGGKGRTHPRSHMSRGFVTKTPAGAFYIPILEALEELGGRGLSQQVLDLVYERMKDRLTEDDLKPIPSGGDLRWRNTAQWARYIMTRNGLLAQDSPRGVWEISEAGKAYLQEIRKRPQKGGGK